ncbi:helix-turn-helix transcriptional regulator [[Clostridium] symbiosum]|uniref:helix-turn-helix transcriptional regulator n=1 Tax=Clostridium symbiosum TaxID=1512 RepID=UPI002ED52B64
MRVRQLRIEKDMKQWELADKLGISLRTYQRIEYGQQKPSYKVVLALQKIFEENIESILQDV